VASESFSNVTESVRGGPWRTSRFRASEDVLHALVETISIGEIPAFPFAFRTFVKHIECVGR